MARWLRDAVCRQATALGRGTGHGAFMTGPRPQPRSIDRRRVHPPYRYLADPVLFGVDPNAATVSPPGGSSNERELAVYVHLLCCEFRVTTRHGDFAALARRHQVSRQNVSDVVRGRCWPSATVLIGIQQRVSRQPNQPPTPPIPTNRTRSGFPIARNGTQVVR